MTFDRTSARRAAGGGQGRCAALTVVLLLLPLAGCAVHGPLGTRLRDDVVRPQPGAVVFLCDGLQPDLLERGCAEGWLPNLDARFFSAGARVEHALSTVPSITYSAIATILTGTEPATHRIAGNRWFDPQEHLFRNYATVKNYRDVNGDFDVLTIYERLTPLTSVSIQAAHMRGVTDNIANWAQSGVRWYFGAYTSVDALTATTVDLVAQRANWNKVWPTLLTCYFPGLDTIGHLYGPDSVQYRRALKNLDHHLGRVCDWMEREGLLESTYLVLLADHGMVAVSEHIDLMAIVRNRWGYHATDKMLQDGSFRHRRRHFDRFDTVVVHQDGRTASLHLAGPEGWNTPPDHQTVHELLTSMPHELRPWNIPGFDLVAYLIDQNEAILQSPRGKARIARRLAPQGWEYRYVPVPGDPLGYQDDVELASFVAAGFHPSRDWLAATCHHEFPDLVPHLIPLLHEPRFGQVLLFPAPGYSFNDEAGGHGGVHRADMRVPLIFVGPLITPGTTVQCARLTDVTPTLMELLGVAPPPFDPLEGVSLVEDMIAVTGDQAWP